jgi:hypothetical protein
MVDDRRNRLDAAAIATILAVIATLASAILLARTGWWLFIALGAACVARATYRSAFQAAIAYGESIVVAFDLYRFELYAALHLPLPDNSLAERQLAQQLSMQWRQGLVQPLNYDHIRPDCRALTTDPNFSTVPSTVLGGVAAPGT